MIQKRGKLLAHFTIVIKPEFRDLCDLLMLLRDQRIHNQSISWEQEMLALISRVIFGGRGEPGGYLSRMGQIGWKIRPIQTRLSLTINPSL